MQGYHFYAVMPDERKSKSASKKFPMQPWTRATLRTYADQGRYVECLAVVRESRQLARGGLAFDCVGALMADNDQAVCGSTVQDAYLRERCTSIGESLARKLHPALFRNLDASTNRADSRVTNPRKEP